MIFGVGICLVVLVVLLLIYAFPMYSMHPLVSGKIEGTDIIAIKNRINNLFFIPSDKEWIVIDAGSDAKRVKQEMDRLSIDRHKVKGVFLTHTDYDHVDSITLFPNATIYMSKQEEQMIDGSTNRQFIKKNSLPKLDAFKIADEHILVHPYTMDRKIAQQTIQSIKDELKNYEKVFTAHYGLIENDIK